ncbi:MAG TPA: NADH-quinone oxidoreductase subunit J [Pyrinomonadaceae bacterium]|nr:NADH-quinone oxidoreductase subunit J [Pyrinomonadaceae bacterium]
MGTILFILFAGLAVGCALSMVVQRNPLYSAISLVGVFISLAALYVTLAAPFIAAVQVIVYAGAIMVLVVFVIMLLNVEEEERGRLRLKFLIPTAIVLAGVLIAEAAFVIYFVEAQPSPPDAGTSPVGLTASIGTGLFTTYLLPFEITSVLLLMAIVGAMTLARRANIIPADAQVIPGAQVLTRQTLDPKAIGDATPIITHSTAEAARVLGEEGIGEKQ